MIDVPPESQVHKQVVRKSAVERTVSMDPATRLCFVKVDHPDMHEPSGDMERLRKALREQWGLDELQNDFDLITEIQPILRKGNWEVTVAIHQDVTNGVSTITSVWPGYFSEDIYGLAIDVGSTTIAAHLCSLRDGEILGSSGRMNPQIRFGEDLMSRVSYAMLNQGGSNVMTRAVREAIDDLARGLTEETGISSVQIFEAVVVCNPVMHHLLLGIDPSELGQAPFALATGSAMTVLASDLALEATHPRSRIHLLPCIAGHVGADAAAVILSEAPHESAKRVLVVDVGTNAEIILSSGTEVLACSSPTGPAFEGAQISNGQRAAPGAIERVEIDPVSKEPRLRVIGCESWSDEDVFPDAILNTGVTGICGSGIIEAIAEMRMAGIIDKSGLIGSPAQTGTERCFADGRTYSYLLWGGTNSDSPPIVVSQNDVRSIQLAKSALYAGARLLMEAAGVDSVDRIILAGAFGAHISPKHAMVLGMVPDCPLDKVISAGNAAGTGARIALCNKSEREEIARTVRDIRKIETAVAPRFQEHFVSANAIPHATDTFPNLTDVVHLPDVSHNLRGKSRQRARRTRPRSRSRTRLAGQ